MPPRSTELVETQVAPLQADTRMARWSRWFCIRHMSAERRSTVLAWLLVGIVGVLVVLGLVVFGRTLIDAGKLFIIEPIASWVLSIPAHLVTPLVAAGAALIAFLALRQKRAADARTEWWKRTQYGLDQLASENDLLVMVGTGMLRHLRDEHERQRWFRARIVDASDLKLFNKVAKPLLRQPAITRSMDTTREANENDEES